MKKDKVKQIDLGCINQNGIYIEGDILLKSERKYTPKYYFLLQILLSLTAVLCTLSMTVSFITAANDSLNVNKIILFFYALISVVGFALLKHKSKFVKIGAGCFTAVQLFFLISNFSKIKTGLFVAVDSYFMRADQPNSVWGSYLSHVPKADYSYYLMYVFIAVTMLLALGTAISCIWKIDFPLLFISTFPFFELGIYWGWEAPALSVLGLMICWVLSISLHIINHTTNKAGRNNTFAVHERKKAFYFTSENEKAKFFTVYMRFVCILCAVIFLIEVNFSWITGFTRPEKFDTYRKNISNAMSNFSFNDLENAFSDYDGGLDLFGVKAVGGTNGGIMGTTEGISFNGSTALQVETNYFSNTMYLKGYVAGVYNDNCWTPVQVDEEEQKFDDYFTSANLWVQDLNYAIFQNKFANYSANEISVKVKGASKKFAYAPYGALYTSDINNSGMKPTVESYVGLGESDYSMYYFDSSSLGSNWINVSDNISNAYSEKTNADTAIQEYENFVYNNYCEIADSNALQQAYDEIVNNYLNLSEYDGSENSWCFDEVYYAIKDYLADNYTYSLTPGVTPVGEDFIDYFLTVQKKGYCSYFATVGVELLRMFGYPARYVEGYMILSSQLGATDKNDDNKVYNINIKDKSAHSWAEVYIDGVGWIPAEFTPGYTDDNPNLTDEEKDPTITTSVTTTAKKVDGSSSKAETKKTGTAKSNNSNAVSEKNTKISSSSQSNTSSVAESEDKKISGVVKGIFVIIGVMIIVSAGFIIRRKMKLSQMENECNKGDENQRVKNIYRYTLKYLSLIDISCTQNLSDIQTGVVLTEICHKKGITDIDDKINTLCKLAVKAHMSGGKISADEAQKAYEIMKYISEKTIRPRLTTLGRIISMYVFGLY
ncbi:MAG: transglutaminase domain-containing protein [Hominimerdicola sp.]